MSKFTEEKLEQAIIVLPEQQGYPYHRNDSYNPTATRLRQPV